MSQAFEMPESLEPTGKMFKEKLASEIFALRARRDARKFVEEEDKDTVAAEIPASPPLVYDPLPTETPELIPGILPERGTTGIVGETDVGKSSVCCEMASSLLTGEPLWGGIQPSRRIEKVVYLLGEHTVPTLQGLYHRLQLPHAGQFVVYGPEHLHPYKALVVGGVAQQPAISRLMKMTEGAGLVVFDPLAGFVQGLAAENDNASMRTLIDAMGLVATTHGAACLVLSHAGKPRIDDAGNEVRRNSYFTRGASAIEDALVSVFYLRKTLSVKQQKKKDQDVFELVLRKFKGNPSATTYRLSRDEATKRNTLIQAVGGKSYPSEDQRQALRQQIANLQASNPKFTWDTCVKIVADTQDLAEETVRRWIE